MESLSSFLVSIGTSATLFITFIVTFLVLASRKENGIFYYPARILTGHESPQRDYSPWKWLVTAWRTTEDELVAFAGLDAVCYLKFLQTCTWISITISLYCVLVLVPICFTANGVEDLNELLVVTYSDNYTVTYIQFDYLSMSNIPDGSDLIWYFAFGGYWVSVATIACLYAAYRSIISLRVKHLSLEKPPLDLYAVLVRDISISIFYSEIPDGFVDSEFGRYGKAYEKCLLIPKLRKVEKAYTKLVRSKRRLQESYNLLEWSKTPENPEGIRPTIFVSWQWPPCVHVDSINYFTEEVKRKMEQLQVAQKNATSFSGAALAFFNDPTVASLAARAIPGINSALWTVSPAPQPEDIEWENVTLPLWNRSLRMAAVFLVTWATVIFYLIPIGFIAAFTTLDNLVYYFPFLESVTDNYTLKTLLEAYLPQLALLTFLGVLPLFLEYITWFEAFPSKSHSVRAAAAKYYYFIVINVFLGYTVSGGVLGILQNLSVAGVTFDTVTNLLASSLPKQSTFFITYIALKFLIFRGLELSGLLHIISYKFKRMFFSKTEQGVRDAWFPGPLPYLWLVPNDLLTVTLGLSYAVIAPLILPFAFGYFAFSWIVYKHQALTFYIPAYDSRGRFWPHMHDRILCALLISQVTLIGYLTLKDFTGGTIFLVPLPILTVAYYHYSQSHFYPTFGAHWAPGFAPKYPPPPVERLVEEYTPECLKPVTDAPELLRPLPSIATKLPAQPSPETLSSRKSIFDSQESSSSSDLPQP